ncbi:Ubiquitin domain [Arabidopsis thaliana x Arabidopsis arenosa]|uniref:Ubiquitin domain n=3 Tax=Arabidopsis TaxID=3701 RepID=A0A8T1XJE4_9BRAS|nr:Ubiquitin domain [Arabidopsis thaliana x Arabidopsis arenosa]
MRPKIVFFQSFFILCRVSLSLSNPLNSAIPRISLRASSISQIGVFVSNRRPYNLIKSKMSATQEEDKKPDQGAHINLKVKGQDGNEVFFRIKRSTQLKKLMNAYCDRQSVDFNSIAFLFDGRRLRAEQTPDELEMEDGDEIDAMLHQTGGGANGLKLFCF